MIVTSEPGFKKAKEEGTNKEKCLKVFTCFHEPPLIKPPALYKQW